MRTSTPRRRRPSSACRSPRSRRPAGAGKTINFGLITDGRLRPLLADGARSMRRARSSTPTFGAWQRQGYLTASSTWPGARVTSRRSLGGGTFRTARRRPHESHCARRRAAGDQHAHQGSAADIIKLAMIALHRRLREQGCGMVLQVHEAGARVRGGTEPSATWWSNDGERLRAERSAQGGYVHRQELDGDEVTHDADIMNAPYAPR